MRGPITPSAACGDPFEGRVEPAHVLGLAGEVAVSKPDEFVLADTIASEAIDCEGIIDPSSRSTRPPEPTNSTWTATRSVPSS